MKLSFKSVMPFVVLVVLALAAMFITPEADHVPGATDPQYSAADIAWVLVSTALVFLMTPGLAFFYGGMVHRKNVISTIDQECCGCRCGRCIMDHCWF
jgi:ammonium transporter, Amt family